MIGILDYGAGNITSVRNAIEYLGYKHTVVDSPSKADSLSHLIVPGVGAFDKAMQTLRDKRLDEFIHGYVQQKKPLLGICLGMQIFASTGYENSLCKGLDLIEGEVLHFKDNVQIPHIGWNDLNIKRTHPVISSKMQHVDFYFVHSYHFVTNDKSNVIATTEHGYPFVSIVGKDNILGVQFHPEKSQDIGLKLLEAFCEWDGTC